MRNRVIEFVRGLLPASCLLLGLSASGQSSSDSTVDASPATDVNRTVPPSRSGKLFFDPLHPSRVGLQPTVLYSSDDRVYGGFCYNALSDDWKIDSAGRKHKAYVHYSLTQRAFNTGYQGIYNRFIGNWDLYADLSYDWVKWINFYGLGNETVQQNSDADFYRIRTQEGYVGLGLQRRIGGQSTFTITPYFQHLQLLEDRERFLSTQFPSGKKGETYNAKNYGGLRADLLLRRLNSLLLPTKGTVVSASVLRGQNLAEAKGYTQYSAGLRVYVPLGSHFVFVTNNGAATVTGRPEFFQLNSIGGNTLRGFRRERFWGETVFHSNNELQYIFNVPARPVRGKMGFTVFADQGRVWKQGETSNRWHRGYGGGILLVPHNKIFLSAQIGVSAERTGFHFTYRRAI